MLSRIFWVGLAGIALIVGSLASLGFDVADLMDLIDGDLSAQQFIGEQITGLLLEAILKRGTGDPYQGERVYMERCASCHKLFFKGGNVGPELTA